MESEKKAEAIEFLQSLQTMEPAAINAMILREAGEELAQFFVHYTANLITREPGRVAETTSSLMLMGYLIRAHEERARAASQASAQA